MTNFNFCLEAMSYHIKKRLYLQKNKHINN